MNAQQVLDQMLERYSELYYGPLLGRMRSLNLTNDTTAQPDPEKVIPGFDPGIIRGEFESALRAMAEDFATSFNQTIDKIASSDSVAGSIAPRFRFLVDHQNAMEGSLRQCLAPVQSALGDLGSARAAYTNFKSSSTSRSLMAGSAGGGVGAAIGSMIFPGLGTVIGAAIGGAIAGSSIDTQEEQLINDFQARYTALLTAVDSSWELANRQVSERFQQSFGDALQRFAAEVESEKARIKATRQRAALPGTVVSAGLPASEMPQPRRTWIWAVGALAACLLAGGAYWFSVARSKPPARQIIAPASLVMRAGPGDSFGEVEVLKTSELLEVVDDSVPGWTKVRTEKGAAAWIHVSAPR